MEDNLIKAIEAYENGIKMNIIEVLYNIKAATLYYHLRKLNKTKPKGTGRIMSDDVKKKMSEQKKGNKNPNFGKYEEWMKKGLEIGRSKEARKLAAVKISVSMKKRWEEGFYNSNNYGGNAAIFIIEGKICKGKNERNYILKYKKDFPCILNNVLPIKTDYGVYTPDFDFGEYFIELKSTHTYDVLQGLYNYKKTEVGSLKQLQKINWVSDNIKPVRIIINYKNDYYSEEEYKKIKYD